MLRGQASRTAGWVAAARSLGSLLPAPLVLVRDPYGVRFASRSVQAVAHALTLAPRLSQRLLLSLGPLTDLVLWMQLRTRFFDDLTRDYLASGGRQLVLLGAGFDCRALRLASELAGAIVYEIDYPATQQHKRRVLSHDAASNTRYVPWDFEQDPLEGLAVTLAELGLAPAAPTLTIWEGVTMYLSESAIDASVRAVGKLGGEGSLLAFNYIDRSALDAPELGLKALSHVLKRAGEPYQFGWAPSALEAWLKLRGFSLLRDVSERALALQYGSLDAARPSAPAGRRIAVARRDP